jgi:hypothetical protein
MAQGLVPSDMQDISELLVQSYKAPSLKQRDAMIESAKMTLSATKRNPFYIGLLVDLEQV